MSFPVALRRTRRVISAISKGKMLIILLAKDRSVKFVSSAIVGGNSSMSFLSRLRTFNFPRRDMDASISTILFTLKSRQVKSRMISKIWNGTAGIWFDETDNLVRSDRRKTGGGKWLKFIPSSSRQPERFARRICRIYSQNFAPPANATSSGGDESGLWIASTILIFGRIPNSSSSIEIRFSETFRISRLTMLLQLRGKDCK